MDDKDIVDLHFERDEKAIELTQEKYGNYCHYIAFNILNSEEDANECVNDAFIGVWNSIPPHRPEQLSTFLGKITRNISLNRLAKEHAQKRFRISSVAFDEIDEFLPDSVSVADEIVLKDIIERFLDSLGKNERNIFLRRYWYFNSVKEIARSFGKSESNVKVTLLRTRKKLLKFLENEKGQA